MRPDGSAGSVDTEPSTNRAIGLLSTAAPTIAPPKLEPGTVVATGRLTGDPLISGDVDVQISAAGGFELRLLNFSSRRTEDVEVSISPRVVEPGTKCTSSIMTLSFGGVSFTPDLVFPLTRSSEEEDPTYFDTVIMTHHDPNSLANECYVPVLSSAVLTWTLPDMRPRLVVADSGETSGARGQVELQDGAPLTYTVAPNDTAASVATRFGMTVDDLFYLNPIRTTIIEYPMLQIGELLNVSKEDR